MHEENNKTTSAALIFPGSGSYVSAMLVSTPQPTWLDGGDMSQICITESGMYCLYLLFSAKDGDFASLSVNGRTIPGSACTAHDGVICSSAVCSIRDAALPCTLKAETQPKSLEGIFLVFRYVV